MSAPELSFDLLEALQMRWTQGGLGDLVTHLQPGLESSRIDELVAPLKVPLPPEVRTWFAWRNGGGRYPWTQSLDLWPLEFAVAENEKWRQIAIEVRRELTVPEEVEWQARWFMFTGGDGSGAFVDTATQGETSRVFDWDPEFGVTDTGVPSLGRLVELAIEAWDTGWYAGWEDGWVKDDSRKPASTPRIW